LTETVIIPGKYEMDPASRLDRDRLRRNDNVGALKTSDNTNLSPSQNHSLDNTSDLFIFLSMCLKCVPHIHVALKVHPEFRSSFKKPGQSVGCIGGD